MIIAAIVFSYFALLFVVKAITNFKCTKSVEGVLSKTTKHVHSAPSDSMLDSTEYRGVYSFQVPGNSETFTYEDAKNYKDSSRIPTTVVVRYCPSDPEQCCTIAS